MVTVRLDNGVEYGALMHGDPSVAVYVVGTEIRAAIDRMTGQVWPDEREAERVEENLRTYLRLDAR